ncbi:MAG: glycosyltransferase family 2 protein [Anaeromyxobacteraceae bacterium]
MDPAHLTSQLAGKEASRSPRVSVALCTYNGAAFVSPQLESLLEQTRLPDELVVFDDASSDSTFALLEEFARRAPFPVRVTRNSRNLGSTANFAKAIGSCNGDFILTCDQDDVWLPEKIALTIESFEENPCLGLVFSDAEVVDEHLRSRGYRLWESAHFGKRQQRLVRKDRTFALLLRQWVVTGATMAFRSTYRPFVLPIPSVWVHDAWIALVIAALAPVGLIERPTVLYRQHAGQQIGSTLLSRREMLHRARRTGPAEYRLELERFLLAAERLGDPSMPLRELGAAASMSGKVAHQALRLAISEDRSRPSRAWLALRELVRGGYTRYSPRTTHVVKDMFL